MSEESITVSAQINRALSDQIDLYKSKRNINTMRQAVSELLYIGVTAGELPKHTDDEYEELLTKYIDLLELVALKRLTK